jgi:hypothetical protein
MSPVYKITTADDEFKLAFKQFHRMVDALQRDAQHQMEHDELESWLHHEGMELLRSLLQGHLDLRAKRELRLTSVIGADDVERRQVQSGSKRGLMSRFGEVQVRRLGYRARGASYLYPMDGGLNLPENFYSGGLRRLVCDAASRGSFDDAVAEITKVTGGKVPKRQTLQLVQDASQDFDAFYRQRQAINPGAVNVTDPLILSVDGKGIVMRPEGLREATRKAAERAGQKKKARLAPGEKPNRKRMATVATVYSVVPHIRSPEQIMGLEEQDDKPPRACNKRVWSSLDRDMSDVIEELFHEALMQDPEKQRPWVVLIDGNLTQLGLLKSALERHAVSATVTLDFIHVLEYLWKAAHCFHKSGTDEAEAWVRARALRILQGHSSHVAAGMRRSATLQKLPPDARKGVDSCADYLLKYRDCLRYDENLRRGLPIATGVIEGACRHLIKDRMDITGARWGLSGAEAVLKMRSLRSSGDLDEYWLFHRTRARERIHCARYGGHQLPKVA